MKILIINNDGKNTKAYFLNPKKSGLPNSIQDIEKITKEDVFDMIDYMIDNEVEIDEYKEGDIPNQIQDAIYKSLYSNFKSILDNKTSMISEIDALFKKAEDKYLKNLES